MQRAEPARPLPDALEERGYLYPFERGNRADECEAIETFLAESLARPSSTESYADE